MVSAHSHRRNMILACSVTVAVHTHARIGTYNVKGRIVWTAEVTVHAVARSLLGEGLVKIFAFGTAWEHVNTCIAVMRFSKLQRKRR